MAENKHDRFYRLAEKRMIKLLRAFRLVGNLSGANYEYTQDDIDKMLAAIDKAREQLEYRFAEPNKVDNISFSFENIKNEDDINELQPLEDDDDEDYETIEHTDANA